MNNNTENLIIDLRKAISFIFENFRDGNSFIQIYTHLDTDGITSGAILGKALYREGMPFQIRILKQLERNEIEKIAKNFIENNNFIIFSDFGSGQYIELQEKLVLNGNLTPFLILDHHLPQNISNKDEIEEIKTIRELGRPWHINSYFYDIDGSIEISGAGIAYFFAKCLNESNIDLSSIAIVGAIGDIQNQGPNKSFLGANLEILEDAKKSNQIEVINDLNFSSIKPLNEAIAYATDFNLPGLTNDANKTIKFLKTSGILVEDSDGKIRSLNTLNQDEKQKISSAIIEYASIHLNIEPHEIVQKLIVNKYLLKNEKKFPDLFYPKEFSSLLNACGRTDNGSLGIAIAMGDRKTSYQKGLENVKIYKRSLFEGMVWLIDKNKIHEEEFIQYFFGEEIISEKIVGVIATMLVFDNTRRILKSKPIFGIAKREDEDVFKISGRAHKSIVEKGVNLSDAIRETCRISNIDVLGGGHPPAAGTKIPTEKIDVFLKNMNGVIEKQLKGN